MYKFGKDLYIKSNQREKKKRDMIKDRCLMIIWPISGRPNDVKRKHIISSLQNLI